MLFLLSLIVLPLDFWTQGVLPSRSPEQFQCVLSGLLSLFLESLGLALVSLQCGLLE